MKNKLFKILGITVLGMAMLTGCASGEGNSAENTDNAAGGVATEAASSSKVVAVGSTTVAVPMEELANKYKEIKPDVVVEIQGVGSSAGIKAIADGTADMGMLSRELKESEQSDNIEVTTIAHDGIAIVLNPANGVENLTSEQVKGIFEGQITNWSEVGGNDEPIVVVTREDGSGTRSAFEEILGLQQEIEGKKVSSIAPTALVAEGNGTIKATVASKSGAIGFVSLGFIDETVKAVSVDGVMPTVETVKSGEYSVSRPLLVVTDTESTQTTQDFLTFILGDEGQEIISEKYISVK